MPPKAPETRQMQIYHEITELNLEFLRLLVRCSAATSAPAFGLGREVLRDIAAMDVDQRDAIAATPCLLAELQPLMDSGTVRAVADEADPEPELPRPCRDHVQVFAASLLTYIWRRSRDDAFLTSLCLGPDPGKYQALARLTLPRIRSCAENAAGTLRARLAQHPCFWPDLVRFVSADDHRLHAISRLRILQLTAIERWPQKQNTSATVRRR